MNVVPALELVLDIPIILNAVSVSDEYDGDFQNRRFVTYTLNFTLKANFFGPVTTSGVIETVIIDKLGDLRKYTAAGDFNTGDITESWEDAI